TASGSTSAVGLLTAGDEVTHAALCIKKGPPPVFIEAVGITGDMKDPTSNQVREADFWTFFQGTEQKAADPKASRYAYHVLRPNYGSTPQEQLQNLQKVIGFAQAQLGKPYDYFFDGYDSRAFFCSELVRKAFEHSPIKLSSNRPMDPTQAEKQAAIAQGIVDSMKYLRDKYKLTEQDLYELSTKPAKLMEYVTVELLGMANDDSSYETFLQNFDRLMTQLSPLMQSDTKDKLVGMASFIRHIAQNGAFDRKNLGDILDFGLSQMGAKIPEGAMRSFVLGQNSNQIRMFSGLVHSGLQALASDAYLNNLGREVKDGVWKRSTSPQDLLFVPADGQNITTKLHFQPSGEVLAERS
ncbi:MAG: YiiX/YebB-like N1pC/P60 family cysteine hydrolase, partial [Bacteroidota bacterium]